MIPVSTLYDEYIDRPKLTEQKKPIWVYSSPPPQEGSEQKGRDINGMHLFHSIDTIVVSESTLFNCLRDIKL